MEAGKILKLWISPTKDSVIIYEDMLYYGTIDPLKNDEIPSRENLQKLNSIPLSYLKSLHINQKKKTTMLGYGKGSDLLIRWENLESMNEFKIFMLKLFPGSKFISREQKIKTKTRGTIAALVVIPIIYGIALLTPTDKTYSSGSKRFGEAIIALFQALASMGALSLTLLFGSLFLIVTLKLFYVRNESIHITIIQLR